MMYNDKSHHIRRRHNTVRSLLSAGIIIVDYVKSKDNVSYPLIKGLFREGVERISKGIGLKPRMSQNNVFLAKYSTHKGLVTFSDGEATDISHNPNYTYSAFFNKNLMYYQSILESLEFCFPAYLAQTRLAMQSLFLAPQVFSFTWIKIWEEKRSVSYSCQEIGLQVKRVSKENLLQARELVNERGTPFRVSIEEERKHEMVLEWKGTSLVALPYYSVILRAIWNPPLTQQGSPQPKYATEVGVSDSDMPHVDFDMGEGIQWPPIIKSIGHRRKALRFTSIKKTEEESTNDQWRFEETKRRLLNYANLLCLRLQVEEMTTEELASELRTMKKRGKGSEWLVFNCTFFMAGDSSYKLDPGPLELFVLTEQLTHRSRNIWDGSVAMILNMRNGDGSFWKLKRYFPETYRHELLSKLYNLRQWSKSVMTYYDEFQQLMLKLDHWGEIVSHDIVHFKVGLNKDISTCMTLHKFNTIDRIFQATLEVESNLNESSFMVVQTKSAEATLKQSTRYEGLNSIKVSLPVFKCESDPKAYLTWESSYDKIFQLNDLVEETKSCHPIAHFEGYANTWWEYVKQFGNEMIEGQPPSWFWLKNLMWQRYLPETYRHEILAKL
ncbi:putative ubiquitin-activating enzyme E1 1-like isoform 1 [Capsicum annuum]|nr:putative ubiquitin-activating enzyme E1 1-like isoform 1 [Capsicum annuum]